MRPHKKSIKEIAWGLIYSLTRCKHFYLRHKLHFSKYFPLFIASTTIIFISLMFNFILAHSRRNHAEDLLLEQNKTYFSLKMSIY